MRTFILSTYLTLFFLLPNISFAQIDEDKVGAWYMYFFNSSIKKSTWGFQGDVQYRNWNLAGDLEQLLVRGGVTFKPKNAPVKFTLGYANITSGAYGVDKTTSMESRIYQEALYPVNFGKRFYTNHRFRFEQRFIPNQNLRTRFRYNFFLNIPINGTELNSNTFYLALYNELFINGQRNIGNGKAVEIFDRNRFYAALGYVLSDNIKFQLGIMNQTTDTWHKNQIQVSMHQNF